MGFWTWGSWSGRVSLPSWADHQTRSYQAAVAAPIFTPSTTNLPSGKISGKPGLDITFYPLPRKTILHDWRRGPSGKWFDDAPGHLMRRWRELQQKGPVFYDFNEAYRER